ncbi:MAG: signal recognition particle protein [Firmicutes bacterium]|nr:signal recognition particle protein [Bacillota bacterium]
MFEALTEKLQRAFKNLRGQGKLSEEHLRGALAQIREALLEADVHVEVADALLARIGEKALGQEVLLQLSPDQQVIKIVRDELTALLSQTARPNFASRPPSVWLLVGLQGSGKTTTTGKLARWLSRNGHRPLVVSTDVYRPAAREQLAQVARAAGVRCFAAEGLLQPLEIARAALREARLSASDVVLVDTAGRLHIDDELMEELERLKQALSPTEILFVADAMTGQDAVKSAEEFHRRLGITGVILTKMDGDARGGAALSIRQVTGQPLKFIGVGEKFDALEPFHPERAASRILGMGDVLSFIEKVEQAVDQKKAEEMQRKLLDNEFTLEDFRDQLKQLKKLGPLDSLLKMMPGIGPLKGLKDVQIDEKEITRVVAIIDSMTPKERANHMIINGSRRRRIARGSGTTVQEVNQLLKQYAQMRKMMKSLTSGSLGRRLSKFSLPGL